MAKVSINAITQHFRGKVGDVVFSRRYGRLHAKLRPNPSANPPNEDQKLHRERFKSAAGYASRTLRNPVLAEPYRARAVQLATNPFALAVKDYFNAPVVTAIDLGGYTGLVGSPIVVSASDDFGLASLEVTIRRADDSVLEQGLAVENVHGKWVYTATVAAPANASLAIEATAKDRADNVRAITVAWPSP